MPRPSISRLFDHVARQLRPGDDLGSMREQVGTLAEVGTFRCAVNRPSARLGDTGPGLTNVGERMIYAEVSIDLRPRDVLQLITGPEAGLAIEVDEQPTNVRGHHLEARCRIFAGDVEPADAGGGDS